MFEAFATTVCQARDVEKHTTVCLRAPQKKYIYIFFLYSESLYYPYKVEYFLLFFGGFLSN